MIAVTGSGRKTKLTFSFTAGKGINEVELDPLKAGGYAIIRDNYILGIIEVVDSLEAADPEEIRKQYLQ